MLACLDLGSRTLAAVAGGGALRGQRPRCRPGGHRARASPTKVPHPEKWAEVPWTDRAGVPIIDGCPLWVACDAWRHARRRRPRDPDRLGARGRCPGRGADAVLARHLPRAGLTRPPAPRAHSRVLVAAARNARKTITSAETAMIPVSRRTIAIAIALLSGSRQRVEVEALELTLRGAAPGRLGQQRDGERKHAVEVVELVRGGVAQQQQDRPEHHLDHHRGLGEAQRVPEADRGLVADPGDAAPDPGDQVGGDHDDADDQVNCVQGQDRILMRKITM